MFLEECLTGDHIVDGTTFHESIVACEQILHERSNISVVPQTEEVVIIGDLHGDLASLAHIYKLMGPPSDSKAYVFNGDIVDRGQNSAEVLFFIMGLTALYPSRVFINRGNHEGMTRIIGLVQFIGSPCPPVPHISFILQTFS